MVNEHRAGGGKGWACRRRPTTTRYTLLRQFRRRACRGRDRRHRPHLGGRRAEDRRRFAPRLSRQRDAGARRLIVAARRAATRRPIAAPPTSCSSSWRSPTSATGCRSSPSRCTASVEAFEREVRAVVLIPGSGEFVYAPEPVTHTRHAGVGAREHAHAPGRHRLGGLARPARGAAAQRQECLAGRRLVRDGSARGAMRGEARRRERAAKSTSRRVGR